MGTSLILAPIALFPGVGPAALHYLLPLTIGTPHHLCTIVASCDEAQLCHTVKQKSRTKTLPYISGI